MLPQNAISQCREYVNPFSFKRVKEQGDRKLMKDTDPEYTFWATTNPSANGHLPYPKGYAFKSCYVPKKFEACSAQIRTFHVRKDDIWVLSFPKTGTTWIQNIVWQLRNGFDFTKEPITLNDAQYLEWVMFDDDPDVKKALKSIVENALEKLDQAPSPRIIKSHFPPNLLPIELWTVRPKIIYITRNPKDTAISNYHMLCNDFNNFNGTIEEYFDLFLNDNTWYAPFNAHVINFWQLRHLDHFLFLTYEELSADRVKEIKKISDFLECPHSDEDFKLLSEYVSFDNMRKMNTKEILIKSDRDPNYRFVY